MCVHVCVHACVCAACVCVLCVCVCAVCVWAHVCKCVHACMFCAFVSGVLYGRSFGFCNWHRCLYERLCERERFELFCERDLVPHKYYNYHYYYYAVCSALRDAVPDV